MKRRLLLQELSYGLYGTTHTHTHILHSPALLPLCLLLSLSYYKRAGGRVCVCACVCVGVSVRCVCACLCTCGCTGCWRFSCVYACVRACVCMRVCVSCILTHRVCVRSSGPVVSLHVERNICHFSSLSPLSFTLSLSPQSQAFFFLLSLNSYMLSLSCTRSHPKSINALKCICLNFKPGMLMELAALSSSSNTHTQTSHINYTPPHSVSTALYPSTQSRIYFYLRPGEIAPTGDIVPFGLCSNSTLIVTDSDQ